MPNAYKVIDLAVEKLLNLGTEGIIRLFPTGLPDEIAKRIHREEKLLRNNPYTYCMLITYEIIKELRYHKFKATLTGDWFCSYYAWLLDLTCDDPYDLALYYKDMGFRMKELIRDECYKAPMEIEISPKWIKSACEELLDKYANEWEFWVWKSPDGSYKLINESYRHNDIYAAQAPIIRFI